VETIRAEHVGYTAGGTPIVRRLTDAQCLATDPDPLGMEHVGYGTVDDSPLAAWAWTCCDAVCTDEQELAGTCYVEATCWPHGPGPGLPRQLEVYLFDVDTCWTARNKRATLFYSDVNGRWEGSVELRGGTLDLILTCNEGLDWDDPGKFSLAWSGCNTGGQTAGASCQDPLVINFPQVTLDDCCDCQLEGTSDPRSPAGSETDVPAEVEFYVVGNCRKTFFAEHVGYLADGTPVVARSRACPWTQTEDGYTCANMRCGIFAELTPVGAGVEACVAGDFLLSFDSTLGTAGEWEALNEPAACGGNFVRAWCEADAPGFVEIHVHISCGVTNDGFGSAVIAAIDLEDLDLEIDVELVDPSDPSPPCGTGTVRVRLFR
jgi:hypothetical protein